jgi:hypothetical protein
MDMSVQLHAPAALSPAKTPSTYQIGGSVAPEPVWMIGDEKISCPYRDSSPVPSSPYPKNNQIFITHFKNPEILPILCER